MSEFGVGHGRNSQLADSELKESLVVRCDSHFGLESLSLSVRLGDYTFQTKL